MKIFFLIFALSIFTFIEQSHAASCKYKVIASNVIFSWTPSDNLITTTVTVENKKPNISGCENIIVGFSKGLSINYNRRLRRIFKTIPYNIFKDSTATKVLKNLQDGDNDSLFYKTITSPSNQITITYYAKLYYQSVNISRGTYRDMVKISVASANKPNRSRGNKHIQLKVTVPAEVNISLVDSGNPYDIGDTSQNLNFGELQFGEMLGFDAIIVSSGNYAVYLSSLNDSRLKHNSQNSHISYSFAINGSPVNLSGSSGSPVNVFSGGETTPSGDVLAMVVTIGNTTDRPSGHYLDYVTITAMATD